MATPNFSNITEAKVSGVRPTNFIDKKKAFAGYERAKKDNYAGDFVQFVTNLEKKGLVVEESTQIKNTKAQQLYQEQKRVDAQKAIGRKIPITEATGSEIRNDLVNDLGEGAKTFLAPSVGMLQGLADIGQGAVGKPIEFLTKKMLGAFGYSDESLESITTQSDISKGLNQEGAKIGREVGKFAGSMALTPGGSVGGIAKGLKGIPYMQEVAKRIAIGVGEGLVGNAAYNVATTDTLGTPVNLGVGAAIGGAFRGLPIIGNAMLPLRDKLASKLQLSGLMTRTKLENLQNILKQGGAEELAQGTPEDVAEWMFQRGLEGNKKVIMTKLDDIIDASTDMLDRKLSKVQGLHDTGRLDDILGMLQKEYDGAISGEFKKKYKTVEGMIAKKSKEGGLTIKEINEVKRMVYKDLNPFTASGKVKASAEDVAFANREIKNFIEDVAQRSGVTEDGLTIKLLNNEFAMADGLKKAIAQRDALDATSAIMNSISHSGSPLALGGAVGAGVGPFDKNTTSGWIGNIVVGALVGRAISSTAVTTKVAGWLRSIPKEQQAKILTIMKKGVQATDAEKNTLLQSFSKLDVDLIDDTDLNFSDEAAAISNSSVPNMVDNPTPQVAGQLDNVASPTADLSSILQNATDEELKANGFTATMIKQFRKKNPLTKVGTTESAIQDIAGKADEVLQEATPMSKVDDALPVGEKMTQKKMELSELGGVKTVKPNNQLKFNQGADYEAVRLVVNDKDAMVARYGALRNKDMQAITGKGNKLTEGEKLEMKRILKDLGIDDATATARHQFLKDEAKKVRSRSDQVLHEIKDDFRQQSQTGKTNPTPTLANGKPLPKVDNTLLSEARKYKSADEFRRSEPKLTVSIDDLKPTEGHTYDNTVGVNGGPRKEYVGKPLLVSFTKDGKYQIHDGNHRYFLAKSKGDEKITVKLMNYTPFTKEEKYHINQLRKIREQATPTTTPAKGKPLPKVDDIFTKKEGKRYKNGEEIKQDSDTYRMLERAEERRLKALKEKEVKPLPKVDNTLLSEARKYKSADDYIDGYKSQRVKVFEDNAENIDYIQSIRHDLHSYDADGFYKSNSGDFGKYEEMVDNITDYLDDTNILGTEKEYSKKIQGLKNKIEDLDTDYEGYSEKSYMKVYKQGSDIKENINDIIEEYLNAIEEKYIKEGLKDYSSVVENLRLRSDSFAPSGRKRARSILGDGADNTTSVKKYDVDVDDDRLRNIREEANKTK